MSKFEVKKIKFPNGEDGVELFVHNKKIGIAKKVDGGYLVSGKRNIVSTAEEAAKQCIDKQLSQHANEIAKLRAMLSEVLKGSK